jgi:hypothetical protein
MIADVFNQIYKSERPNERKRALIAQPARPEVRRAEPVEEDESD